MPVPVPGQARLGEDVGEEEAGNRGGQQIKLSGEIHAYVHVYACTYVHMNTHSVCVCVWLCG